MGVLGKFARMIVYPIVRPMETVRDATAQIRGDLAKGKEMRAKHATDLAARAQAFAADSSEVTAEQLLNPALIRDPRKRFRVLAELKEWDEAGLAEQLVAVRRGKRFAIIAAAFVFVLGMTTIFMAPAWIVFVLSPCLVVVVGYGVASSFKYGLMQYQLESKALYGAKDYFSRPDFFSHLAW